MIKHQPKFYVRLAQARTVYPDNFQVYQGSVYGRFCHKNGKRYFWVCDNYALIDGKLPVHVYNGKDWTLCRVDSSHPVYQWVKSMIENLGYIPKVQKVVVSTDACSQLMKTNSRHKKGTGGRINTHQINNPLQWREVTELGHWANCPASVVGNNIRE